MTPWGLGGLSGPRIGWRWESRLSGTRPMACPISCSKTNILTLPVTPLATPTKPSGPGFGVSPKAFASLEVTQKFDIPLILSPAGRLAALKKPGCPEASKAALSCEYVVKTAVLKLAFPPETGDPGLNWFAVKRSKAEVERQCDVIRERRIVDIDGGLLIGEKARIGLGGGIIHGYDLHDILSQKRAAKGG
jgi:hypothetical protein